jgi:DNA-binding NarL/FixJ family response regulator
MPLRRDVSAVWAKGRKAPACLGGGGRLREAVRFGSPTIPRQRVARPSCWEILALVSSGLMNKQIAAELGLAETTVKIHRGHIMKKMGAKSLADLVMKAETLGIRRTRT